MFFWKIRNFDKKKNSHKGCFEDPVLYGKIMISFVPLSCCVGIFGRLLSDFGSAA